MQPMAVAADLPPPAPSPSKSGLSGKADLMFSGLPASVIEADKMFVYKQGGGDFSRDKWHHKFEYVVVFPMMGPGQTPWKAHADGNEPSNRARDIVNRMITVGLEVYPYLSLQGDELILLITAPLAVLSHFADHIDFVLELDPAYCKDKLSKGDAANRIRPIKITDNPEYSPIHPFAHVFGKYDENLDHKIYLVKEGNNTAFDLPTRLKLLHYMITMPRSEGGCGVRLATLLLKNEILAFYPPHDKDQARALLKASSGLCVMPWNQPYEEIRDYFGEKVALYYVFMGHYSLWLLFPALVGLSFELVVWGTGPNFSHPVLPFYGVCITVWSICMLEYWKRQQAFTAMRWGMLDFEKDEPVRAEFEGNLIKSFINGEDYLYFPEKRKERLVFLSMTVIWIFIGIVIGTVAGIYVMRYVLSQQSAGPVASAAASAVNTIQIVVFNLLYGSVAIKLTNNENHRTDTQYQDSLILKTFIFQFVNSYASFFFLAFIAGNLEPPPNQQAGFQGQCGWVNCMQPLSVNLAIIFGSRLTVTNLLDMLLPIYAWWSKKKAETEGKDVSLLTPPEHDYVLQEANILLDSIQNFADTAVQYGFTVLFITALPIATFFSLVSNYIKVKLQLWKLLTLYQRPVPQGAQDIGTWQDIFNFISVAAVVTNAAIICFTMDVLYKDSQSDSSKVYQIGGITARANFTLVGRLWIFFGFIAVLVFIQFVATYVIPDTPLEVEIQHQRQEFIVSKIVNRQPDESEFLPLPLPLLLLLLLLLSSLLLLLLLLLSVTASSVANPLPSPPRLRGPRRRRRRGAQGQRRGPAGRVALLLLQAQEHQDEQEVHRPGGRASRAPVRVPGHHR